MLSPEIEIPLSQIELRCEALAAAIDGGEPVALEAASSALRQASVDFSGLLQGLPAEALSGAAFKARVKKIADGMAIQRESLIRRTVFVERAVHAMVPAARGATYAPLSGAAYGGATKQTGAFKVLAA